jgi:AcrR family transcriptional regulator
MLPTVSSPSTRRERQHLATVEEVKAVARDLMARDGTGSLNLRAIAREMGMTASALYRYFPSRDAILTALVVDAYDAVGSAVEEAVARAPVDTTCTAILAAAHAFRRWALDHPQEYGLTYGPPVPGYEAPEQETAAAKMRTNIVLLTLLKRALDQGIVRIPEVDIPARLRPGLRTLDERVPGMPLPALAAAMQFWMVLYGAIAAEVFGHMPRPLLAQAGILFDRTIRTALSVMGVAPEALTAAISPKF